MRGRSARLAARLLAVGGVLLAVLALRTLSSSRAELARGDAARARGDLDAAILAYRRSARWYAPGSPYVTEALDRLAALAVEAEGEGDTERALAAWRAVRGAILSTRSLYVPHAARLARAEAAIAEATAALEEPARRAAARRRVREAFERPERPRVAYSVLLLLGWLGWTGGAFGFATRALDEEDRIRPGPARALGTLIILGFGLFVLGLMLA